MMPPVIHSLTEVIIEECVAIFIIAGVPKHNLRISVAVVVTSIHELQLTRQVQRILRDEKPVCGPFGTRRKLACVRRLLETQGEELVSEGIVIAFLKR